MVANFTVNILFAEELKHSFSSDKLNVHDSIQLQDTCLVIITVLVLKTTTEIPTSTETSAVRFLWFGSTNSTGWSSNSILPSMVPLVDEKNLQ